MKGFFFIVFLAVCFCSCNSKTTERHRLSKEELRQRQDSLRDDLLKTDLAFSQMSEDKGRNAAFLAYADSDATMLRQFSLPTTGKAAISNLLSQFPDSSAKLTWIPVHSDVARSAELGYTYGTYTLEVKGVDKFGGTYCTIWKRSKANGWKYLLSTGNPGVKAGDVVKYAH